MPLSELLYNWKQKTIGPKDVRVMLNIMKQHQLSHVPLWRINFLAKLITGVAKLQAYLMIYAGLLFIPPMVYEKYQENP